MKKISKQLIISFSHSNYCSESGGTEQFIREYSKKLQANQFDHVVFFPIVSFAGKLGVIHNDKFIGIYQYKDLIKIINWFIYRYNYKINSIDIQHLLNHNLDIIQQVIEFVGAPVYIFVHDFYLICNSVNLIDSDGNLCGYTFPSSEKCSRCAFAEEGISHWKNISQFMDQINVYLDKIIVPSAFVKDVIKCNFQKWKEKIVVRPHLIQEGSYQRSKVKNTLKIAFVGNQIAMKGYEEWIVLTCYLKKMNGAELFYFGYGKDTIEEVNNIYVSSNIKSKKGMTDYIKQYGIDMAFMWPHCGETYSYVYYELLAAGVFIITNSKSGNVAAEVKQQKNGIVFDTFDECLEWIADEESVIKMIDNARELEYPKTMLPNNTIYVGKNIDKYQNTDIPYKRVRKLYGLSYLYRLRKILKRRKG